MKLLLWLSLLGSIFLMDVGAVEPAPAKGPVVVVPLRTEVSDAQFFLLRRALKEAERDGASAFIIDMETPGGAVDSALRNMEALQKTKVPTYTYINDRALSAGALIALATQKIYMAPTAVIGAAAPVMAGGQDLPQTMTDKTVSMLAATARAAAQKNGHNSDIAEAFVKKEKEVKIGEVVIDKADSLLTLSADEATRQYDGKPLLAAGTAATLEELLSKAGLTGPVRRIEPTGFEQLALWITALAPIFLLGGIVGAYMEFKTPGFGLPGILGLICFAIFFTGHYLAGLAGWEVMAVFVIGVLLVLGELFLHPGTIVPGLVGALMMVGALIWAMIDRYPGDAWWPTSEMLTRPLINLGIAFLGGIFAIYLLAKMLPKTSLYGHIVLGAASGAATASRVPIVNSRVPVGSVGIAHTMLRPSGKAEFDGLPCDVVTSGDFIDPGAKVRVVAVDGTRVVVEATGGS
jgi:membrane-bound serine protease (ClpP class)